MRHKRGAVPPAGLTPPTGRSSGQSNGQHQRQVDQVLSLCRHYLHLCSSQASGNTLSLLGLLRSPYSFCILFVKVLLQTWRLLYSNKLYLYKPRRYERTGWSHHLGKNIFHSLNQRVPARFSEAGSVWLTSSDITHLTGLWLSEHPSNPY